LTFAQTYGHQQQIMVDNRDDMALVVSARAYSVLKSGGTQWKPVWAASPNVESTKTPRVQRK
jgi:putative spermidine/putrescine transport system substrate-binding protein